MQLNSTFPQSVARKVERLDLKTLQDSRSQTAR
jgi:hypothetical protein